jgi:hypothetical protein
MQLQNLEALRKPETRKTSRSESPLSIFLTAKLIGSRRCDCESYGICTVGHAPVLALCRELIAAGANPDMSLAIYRGEVLALRIRSIGEAAELVVEDSQNGCPRFRLVRPARRGAASPMRKNGLGRTASRPTARECLPNRCRLTAEQDCAP